MKRKIKMWSVLITVSALLLSGCGSSSGNDITKLENGSSSAEESAEPLDQDNTLPEDGIITAAQMKTIAGKEGLFTFSGTDKETGISYKWSYDGSKIQNPVEQHMKVTFPSDKTEEVKAAAGSAAVGLGISLAAENLAAPSTLTITMTQKWDANTVILCKYTDGIPKKMSDVSIGTAESGGGEVTTLIFNVVETGDTYFAVGGNSASASSDPSGGSTGDGSSVSAATSQGQAGDTGTTTDAGTTGSSHTCQISVECSTILSNMSSLDPSKTDFVPSDGWIIYPSTVEYSPGETVYDVLVRTCRAAGITYEASFTPAYNAYYVEGINQLYERDCGSLSGWEYRVNGWFPNYGVSNFKVSDGDIIEFKYTCDNGRDVGNGYNE